MRYFNYNGKSLAECTPVFGADSRAVRYGDGIFETMKFHNGQLVLADDHFARLWKGMSQLQFDIPKLLSPEKFTNEINDLVKKNKDEFSRIRLGIFRGNGGVFDPVNHTPEYLIQSWPLATSTTSFNSNGLQMCIYHDAVKPCDQFSQLKHNNYLPYFMAARFAQQQKCNDAIILNQHGRICDTTIANIFIIKNHEIFTPPLSEGCVAGITRKFLLQNLHSIDFSVNEKEISIEEILSADEIFTSNSIANIRWISAIGNSSYGCNIVAKIDLALRQTFPDIFC